MAEGVVAAVRASHERMRGLVEGLDEDRLRTRSYAEDWSVAQVASHLGSQAEIFELFLTAGLTGGDPPGGEVFVPIWDRWNAKPPAAQATDSVATNEAFVARLESVPEDQPFALSLFGQDLDLPGLATLRLSEHALHTWDIAVALDPSSTVPSDAVHILIDTLPGLAARAGTPVPGGTPVVVATTDPARLYRITTDPAVTLTPATGDTPDLTLPAEAFLRLVAGRLDPARTPPGHVPPGLETTPLTLLHQTFQGF